MKIYCVMIPTHRNPEGRFDFKWRRKFSRRHDAIIMKNVATMHGGYTLIPPSEGCWMLSPDRFQVEGMRPFLFTAENQAEANIIADLVGLHYGQRKVMTFVWGCDVQFRKQWKLIPFYTNMLLPKRKVRIHEGTLHMTDTWVWPDGTPREKPTTLAAERFQIYRQLWVLHRRGRYEYRLEGSYASKAEAEAAMAAMPQCICCKSR